MGNLNAEQIKNEIQSLIKALKDCGGWVKRGNGEGWFNHEILADALALITSQEQKIFQLENRLKECENGYEGTLHLESCKLHDAEEKINELTAENESLKQCMEHEHASFMETFGEYGEKCESLEIELKAMRTAANSYKMHYENVKAATVRKMQSEIKKRCIEGGIYPAIVKSTIDQVAKEILNDES